LDNFIIPLPIFKSPDKLLNIKSVSGVCFKAYMSVEPKLISPP